MAVHLGLIILKGASKPIIEMILEYYACQLVKKNGKYMAHHIEQICTADDKDSLEFKDTYLARVKGYCTTEEAMKKIEDSNSKLAIEIKGIIKKIHEEGDYLVIDSYSREDDIQQDNNTTQQDNSSRYQCIIQ